jgi:hypothetical protein
MHKLTIGEETYKIQRLMTSCASCWPLAKHTSAVEGEGRISLLVCKNLLIGITANPLEIISMSHDVGVTIVVEDTVVFDIVVDPFVSVQDCVESRECVMIMNSCADGGVSGVVGDHQLGDVAAECPCGTVVISAGMTVELSDGDLALLGLMSP